MIATQTWRYIDIGKTGQFVSRDGQELGAAFTKLSAEEYLLETDLGSKFHFVLLEDDAWGRYGVDWIENANGFRLTMEYDTIPDGSARLLQVTDSYGRMLQYDWGWLAGHGHIVTKVTAPDGREIHYSYSTPYDYTVRYPNGDVSSYRFASDSIGDYFAFDDALGASHSRKHRAYMGENNLCRGVRAIDGSWILVPDFVPGSTDSIVYRYASGREETYTLNGEGRPVSMVHNGTGATKSFTWDYKGFPLSVTNYAGETTTYEYDAQNRLVKQTNPDGSFRTHAWSGDRIIATTNENGDTIASEYDAAGNRTKVTYPDGSTELRTFGHFGLVTSYTDRNGHTTAFDYDAYGFLAKTTLPKLSAEASAPVWSYEHDINGRRLSATDPMGRVTRWTYDAVDRIVKVTYPDRSTEEVQYGSNRGDPNDPAGTTGQVVARKDRNGNWTHYTYDQLDNVLTQTDSIGVVLENTYLPGTTLVLTKKKTGDLTVNQYDANGWLASSSQQADRDTWLITAYERDSAGRVTRVTDHNGFETITTYDAAGRIGSLSQQILGTAFAVTTFEYDGLGQEIKRTDPNGNDWIREYDSNARLVRTLNPVGGEMLYTYDPFGNRTAISQRVEGVQYRTTTSTYNERNRIDTTTDPAGNVVTHTYYPDDRLASVANAGTGGLQSYQYACCGRMTAKTTYVDGGPADIVERYTYDGNGNVVQWVDGEGFAWETRYDAREPHRGGDRSTWQAHNDPVLRGGFLARSAAGSWPGQHRRANGCQRKRGSDPQRWCRSGSAHDRRCDAVDDLCPRSATPGRNRGREKDRSQQGCDSEILRRGRSLAQASRRPRPSHHHAIRSRRKPGADYRCQWWQHALLL